MKKYFSRFHPHSVRSLVYMLQASEYNVSDYLKWLKRVADFVNVEERKELNFTAKALILLGAGWGIILAVLVAIIFSFVLLPLPWSVLLALLLVVLAPYMLSYGLVIAVWKLHILQFPVARLLEGQAARTLARHKGVKIAIAGSYGKTSMREILKTVIGEGKKVAAPGGSYNTPLGIAKFVKTLKGDEDVLIFEFGEYYPGDIKKLARMVRPNWGIITGVNEAHLEKFKTLKRTTDTIFELAEFVAPDHLYVNAENKLASARMKSGNIGFSREGAGVWRVENTSTGIDGTTFTLKGSDQNLSCNSSLLGLHMVGPLVLAADLARWLGLTSQDIQKGIAKTKPFEHRLEPKQWTEGVTFLDDSYNGNPDGVRAVIAFLASLNGHRRFYVTPGLVEAGSRVKEIHEEIGRELASAGIDKVLLIQTSVTPYIEAGLAKTGFKGEILKYRSMPQCLTALRSITLPGDVVLVQNDWPDQYM